MSLTAILDRRASWPVLLSLSALASSVASAQSTTDVAFSDQVAVEWVSVSAVVESKRKPLPELEPGMFRLFVDGREVDVDEFEPTGEIVNLLYLQDVSGSMDLRRRMVLSKAAYAQTVRKLLPGDHVAVATFAAPRLRLQQPFTDDHILLAGVEQGWRGYGETALIDTAAAIPQLARAHYGRVSALMVTDGVDTASELPAEQVQLLLSGAGIPFYVFGLEGASASTAQSNTRSERKLRDMRDVASAAEVESLQGLARASGGRYVNLTETSVELAVSRVLRDIRNRVFLGFPTDTSTARSMHKVEVRFLAKRGSRKGTVVHHRTHYFGYEPRGWMPQSRSPE